MLQAGENGYPLAQLNITVRVLVVLGHLNILNSDSLPCYPRGNHDQWDTHRQICPHGTHDPWGFRSWSMNFWCKRKDKSDHKCTSATSINTPKSFPVTRNKCESLYPQQILEKHSWVLAHDAFSEFKSLEKNSTVLSTWHQAARHVCQQPLHCHRLIGPETRNSCRFSIENCKKNSNTHHPSDFPWNQVYCVNFKVSSWTNSVTLPNFSCAALSGSPKTSPCGGGLTRWL